MCTDFLCGTMPLTALQGNSPRSRRVSRSPCVQARPMVRRDWAAEEGRHVVLQLRLWASVSRSAASSLMAGSTWSIQGLCGTACGEQVRIALWLPDIILRTHSSSRHSSLFINTALLLWAFNIREDPKAPLDSMNFTDTLNVRPLPFKMIFEPRMPANEIQELIESHVY